MEEEIRKLEAKERAKRIMEEVEKEGKLKRRKVEDKSRVKESRVEGSRVETSGSMVVGPSRSLESIPTPMAIFSPPKVIVESPVRRTILRIESTPESSTPSIKVDKGKGRALEVEEEEGQKLELDPLFKEEPASAEEEEESEGEEPALPQESEEAALLEAALAGGDDGGVEPSTYGGSTAPFDPWAPIPLARVEADGKVEEAWERVKGRLAALEEAFASEVVLMEAFVRGGRERELVRQAKLRMKQAFILFEDDLGQEFKGLKE